VQFLSKGSPKIWATFFQGKSYALSLTKKNGLGYFLGVFSETHLVTLLQSSERRESSVLQFRKIFLAQVWLGQILQTRFTRL
jgi:hypothetical protein